MQAFDGTPIASIRNTETGILFTMRLVCKGDRYGRDDCLTHDKDDPLVEFYDSRYAGDGFGPYGQFVSRYYLSTLRGRGAPHGLNLDGGIPSWYIDAPAMCIAFAILQNWRS